MKLCYDKKLADPIYYVQHGFRNGKKTSTKTICRIGKHSELLKDGHKDPLAYAKSVVEKYNEDYKNNKVEILLNFDYNQKLISSDNTYSKSTALNIGYFYLQSIYNDLKIKDFIKEITKESKITFDLNDINRFLTFDRILNPKSKLAAVNNLDFFYEKPSFSHQNVLRGMDVLASNYDNYLKHLYEQSENIVKRDTSVCYYDCTNYYFEIENEDSDYIDEVTGEVIPGFRKYGPSKEHRPNPIVEMGLFMDKNGIPLSMGLYPGNTNEQKTVN